MPPRPAPSPPPSSLHPPQVNASHKHHKEGQKPPPSPPPLHHQLDGILVILWLLALGTSVQIQLLATVYASYRLWQGSSLLFPVSYSTILLILLSTPLLPKYVDHDRVIKGRLSQLLVQYFSYDIIVTQPAHEDQQCLLAQFPHGLLPVGAMMSPIFLDRFTGGRRRGYCLCADFLFYFPVFRYYLKLIGGIPASKENLREVKELGHHASIVVGGVAEMFLVAPGRETVYLRHHGFIREAIRLGFTLVPAYTFGNNRLYDLYFTQFPTFMHTMQAISRRIRFPLCLFGSHYFLPIPYRRPLLLATGHHILVNQMDDPSWEEVERVYHLFKLELARVYYECRPAWHTEDLYLVEGEGQSPTKIQPPPRSPTAATNAAIRTLIPPSSSL